MVEVCPQAAFGKTVQGRQLSPASQFWLGGGNAYTLLRQEC